MVVVDTIALRDASKSVTLLRISRNPFRRRKATVELLLIGVIVALAACVQGAIGFGLGMLAAPLIALIAPELLPGTVLVLATFLSLSAMLRERSRIDWGIVGWASLGRIPGSLLGAAVVALLPPAGLTLGLAAAVLLGVLGSALGWSPRRTTGTLLMAGGASGVLGTATSIGGPPMALVLRGEEPAVVRATMSGCFVVGCLLSLGSLLGVGALTGAQLRAAALLLPFVLLGLLASGLVNRRVDGRRLYRGAVAASVLGSLAAAAGAVVALLS